MSFYPQLDDLALERLKALFRDKQLPTDLEPTEAELWYQELAGHIGRQGEEGLSFLLGASGDPDATRIRAALLGLSFVDEDLIAARREEIESLLVGFLANQEETVVAEAVDALRDLGFDAHLPEVEVLLQKPSPFVVGSALRYMSRYFPDRAVPILIASLSAPDPIVRENAIDELDELDWSEALPAIQPLLNDPNPNVRQAAQTAVEHFQSSK